MRKLRLLERKSEHRKPELDSQRSLVGSQLKEQDTVVGGPWGNSSPLVTSGKLRTQHSSLVRKK